MKHTLSPKSSVLSPLSSSLRNRIQHTVHELAALGSAELFGNLDGFIHHDSRRCFFKKKELISADEEYTTRNGIHAIQRPTGRVIRHGLFECALFFGNTQQQRLGKRLIHFTQFFCIPRQGLHFVAWPPLPLKECLHNGNAGEVTSSCHKVRPW